MRRILAAVGVVPLLAVAVLWARAASQEEFPRGRVVEKIPTLPDATKSYALYLPSSYDPVRRWPILYVLDPRGRAVPALERFRDAAERAGWILASSYDTASDTEGDPNRPAVNALWGDTHARFAVDPRRAYLAGFSGTGRAAVSIADASEGSIAGVIDCGAGFPYEPKKVSAPYPLFLAVGEEDFNYLEVRGLDETLAPLGVTRRVEIFDGGHDWLPASLAPEALAWLDLMAMRTGARGKDEEAVADFGRAGLARGAAHETAGRRPEALREAETLVADLEGLGDTAPARALLARLSGDPAVQKAVREERRSEERERRDLSALVERLRGVVTRRELPTPVEAARELGVPSLRRKASSKERNERLPAARLLADLSVQTGYYLPDQALARGDRARALFLLGIAREADPESPLIPFRIAAVQSQAGDTARARKSLEEAIALGFRRLELIESEPDFAALRKDPGFGPWMEQRRRSVTPSPPAPAMTPAAAASGARTTAAR